MWVEVLQTVLQTSLTDTTDKERRKQARVLSASHVLRYNLKPKSDISCCYLCATRYDTQMHHRHKLKYTEVPLWVECMEKVWAWVCHFTYRVHTSHIGCFVGSGLWHLLDLSCRYPLCAATFHTQPRASSHCEFSHCVEHTEDVVATLKCFWEGLDWDVGDPQFIVRRYKTALWVDRQGQASWAPSISVLMVLWGLYLDKSSSNSPKVSSVLAG